MSKYNLTDILEQYKIGSGWTTDFDYEGMLNAGLKATLEDRIESLAALAEDFTDVNYHREASHLYDAIEALEKGDAFEAEGKISDFHAEIRKTMESFDMDMSDDLGAYMASKMDMMNEDEFDEARQSAIESSQEAAGIKEEKESHPHQSDDEFLRQIDKLHKDKQKEMEENEELKEVTSREGARIEGLLSIPLKSKFLEAFQDLYFDLVEEDPFMAEDVVDHLGIEMLKHLDAIQAQGDRLAGLDQQEFTAIDEEDSVEEGYEDTKGKALYPILKAGANATGDEVEMYVKSLAKDIELNGKEQYKDFTSDDYVEDFKNYIADKSLQEHFGRFMKDYQ